MIDMYLALVINHRRTIVQVPIQFRAAVTADLIALGLDGNGNLIVEAIAPNVTANDIDNTIVGINSSMEYTLDGATDYTPYTVPFDLSGEHIVKVRVKEVIFVTYASSDVVLVFTNNPITPEAPLITNDDIANTVIGMALGMEYKLDAAEYVVYDETEFTLLDFSGEHILSVRVSAEGNNPFGLETVLTFTTN